MHFNQLLQIDGVDPASTVVLRHRPPESRLRSALDHIAQEQHHLFHTYQSFQGSEQTSRLIQNARYVAAMLALEGDSAVFVGIYEMKDHSTRSRKQLLECDDVKALIEKGWKPARRIYHWHDLELTDHLCPFRFSLSVRWHGRRWDRRAHRNVFEVLPFPVAKAIRMDMPDWDKLDLTWGELKNLPQSWQARLSEWRGIYCIFDTAIRQAYIGAAYGRDNLLGRWLNYAKRGHGGNKLLRERDPKHFRFSILQLVSPTAEPGEVQELEASWKRRLHTRNYGLNEN